VGVASGVVKTIAANIQPGINKITYDGMDIFRNPLANGIYLLNFTHPRYSVMGTGKLVIAR